MSQVYRGHGLYVRRKPTSIFAWHSRSGLGLTLHRRGGITLVGIPRSGGTTVAWGRLDRRMREIIESGPVCGGRRIEVGRVSVYAGENF